MDIGQDNIRKIPVDDAFRMRVDLLRETVAADQRAGKRPFCIVPTVGTTSTSSIDPVDAVADVAEECGAWLHVDAAYGGAAAVVPELQSVLDGAERAAFAGGESAQMAVHAYRSERVLHPQA